MDTHDHADLIRDDIVIRTERALKSEIDTLLAEHPGSTHTYPHALMLRLFRQLDPVEYALMRSEYVKTDLTLTTWPPGVPEAVVADLRGRIQAKVSVHGLAQERTEAALDVARQYGQAEGSHHKAWVIDQLVRALLGDRYEAWVAAYRVVPGDSEDTYRWDEGVAP